MSAQPAIASVWLAVGSMTHPRLHATATLLPDGRVLVPDGAFADTKADSGVVASADVFDSSTRTWTATDAMLTARGGCTTTRLQNGKVLVVGGYGRGPILDDAELYDPATGHWTAAGHLSAPRAEHTASLLADGRVLVAGGNGDPSGKAVASEAVNHLASDLR